MCRFTAYLGPPVTLAALLVEPSQSLLRQAWAPSHQTHGVVNADGFGVGWWDHARREEPARYRSPRPMWADASFASLAGLVASGAVLAAVRSATPPLPVEESATPPYTDGKWLFAHNGAVKGFRDGAASLLRRTLSERRDAGIAGPTDSEVLFAMVLDRLDGGAPPGEALAETVKVVQAQAGGRLNMVLGDGRGIHAVAWGESLFAHRGENGSVVVASEPSDGGDAGDDPGWQRVPDASILRATAGELAWSPL
ncbi:MAG: ergothioneine biosynthesis protein EgtC [Acidimicrobiales bacterium]